MCTYCDETGALYTHKDIERIRSELIKEGANAVDLSEEEVINMAYRLGLLSCE